MDSHFIHRIVLLAAVLLSNADLCYSQFDTRFWMPPLWNDDQSNHTEPSELFITTPYPTPVSVHIETPDGITFVLDTTVVSGNPLSVELTPALGMTNVSNAVLTNAGFIITSSAPIQAVHKISAQFNQTLVTLKGKNGRGTDFYCGSQVRNMNANYSPNEYHYISVMAMEDNTTITFDTPFNMFLAGPGDLANPYVLTLDRYECYLIRGNSPIQHVAGSHVTSDKEIVVISGSTHTRILGGNAADGGTDQLVPVELMGTEFVIIKGDNDDPFDYSIVVATEDDTDVFFDDNPVPVANLDAGEFYDITTPGAFGSAHYIRTDKTAYCYHFTGASQDDEVGMSAIPQVECTGSRYIEFSKFTVNTQNQVMNIIATPEAAPTLELNGVYYEDVPGVISGPVPGLAGWVGIAFPNNSLDDNNILTSEGFFHAGFLTGNGGATGTYGFLSGFNDAFEFLDPESGLPTTVYQVATLCQGESVDHCLQVFSCSDDHNIISVENSDGIVTVTPINQPYDTCLNYLALFDFTGYDTITVTVENRFGFTGAVDLVFLVLDPDTPIDAGPVQQLCSPQNSATLSAVNPDPLVNGYWTVLQGSGVLADANAPTTLVTNLSLGTNTFLWTQDYGCETNQDLTQIIVFNGVAPAANAGPDVLLCSNQNSYVMQANNPGVSAIGTWEILQGNATITNINNASATVTNIGIGVNIFEWNIDNGPCPGGATSDQMTITVYNQNAPAANAGPDQQFCSAGFLSATLAGNQPASPATGSWTVVSGSGNFVNPGQHNTQVTGLSPGDNVFQWTINNGPCGTTTDTIVITIFDSNVAAANAGPDAEYCGPVAQHVMAATPPVYPATGSWTLVSGSGAISSPNSPISAITNLAVGVNTFRWTINNGPCVAPPNFDEVNIVIFDPNAPAANAGADQEFCSIDFISAQLQGNSPVFPASGSWSVVEGTGAFSDAGSPNSSVSGLSLGDNTFRWTIDNGPCGISSDDITITLFNANVAQAQAGNDASYCTPNTQHQMAAAVPAYPASGVWQLLQGSGTISDVNSPTATISNLGIGENIFQWSINNGPCGNNVSSDLVSIFIYDGNQPAANAGPDQEFCSSLFIFTEMAANTPIFPATGFWEVISGSGIISDVSDPGATITGLSIGENIFQWTISNGPCPNSLSSDIVVITLFENDQAPANAGPDAFFCTPISTYQMQATPAEPPAQGVWTLVSGTGTISNVNNPNANISGLGIGENIYRWTIDNGACGEPTFDEISIFIFDENQPLADAGPDQEFCWSPAIPINAQMDANEAIFPGIGEWTIVQGSGTIQDVNDPQTIITNPGIGINIFQWTISNGPCEPSESFDQVIINVFTPFQSEANAGPDQSICSDQLALNLDANELISPATGNWSVVTGSGIFANPSDPNTTVSGYGIGINIYRWTIDNGVCAPPLTSDEVTVLVYDVNAPLADAGPDQTICSNQNSVFLDASASVFPGIGTWSVLQGTGVFSDPNDPQASVSGLSIGENILLWTIDNGPCPQGISTDTVSIFVHDDNAPAASAGPDQQLCVPQTSTLLAGNSPVFPSTGLWTVISGTGIFADPSDPNTEVSGLSVGQNILRWTISYGPCLPASSFDNVTITVFDANAPAANAGLDQSYCTPVASANLGGNTPLAPASGNWTLVSGTGAVVNPGNPNSQVTGLSVGANVFEWTISNGPCGLPTSDQVTIFIYDEDQSLAAAGPDQILCSPESSALLQANDLTFPASGLWELISGSGFIQNPGDPQTQVNGLAIGVNTFRWTVFNGPCSPGISSDEISILVYDSDAAAANAGDDQDICTPQNSVTLTGNDPVVPATGLWTLVSGSGTIVSPNTPVTQINNLGIGINIFQWTINNGPCGAQTSSDQVIINVFSAQAPAANAGPDQNLCTPETNTTLQGNTPVIPASGEWTLISGTGIIADPGNPNSEVTGLSIGINVFQWSISNGPCANSISTDLVTITVFDGGAPAAEAGPNQDLCSPQFSTFMNADPAVPPGTGSWSVFAGTGVFSDPADPLTEVSGLEIGENIFVWTLDYSTCGIQADTVVVMVYDSSLPPANAGEDQELCTPQNSTVLDADAVVFPASGFWTVISGNSVVEDPLDPQSGVTNLTIGQNTFVWNISSGGCLDPSFRTDTVNVFLYDALQPAANAGPDQNICTPLTTASLQGNSPIFPAVGEWTLISGSGIIANPSSPSTEVSGLAVGENVFQWTIFNGPCPNSISQDLVSIFVFDQNQQAANAGPDQELCWPGNEVTMAANPPIFPATGSWLLLSGTGIIADTNDPNTNITGLSIGENIFRWTINNGPCGALTSNTVSIFVFDNTAPQASAGPDQELCFPESSTVLNANAPVFPASGSWSVIQGSGVFSDDTNPASSVSGLSIGENILVWTISNGPCENGLTTDTLSVFVFDPANPTANAGADQSFCTPVSSTQMTAEVPLAPSVGTWQLAQGSGTITDPSDPFSAVEGLAVGENIFSWTVYNGPCDQGSTVDFVSVFIFDETQSPANAGPDQNLCTPQISTTLAGNSPIFPATGEWEIIQGGGLISNPNNPTSAISNLPVGINILVWTINNGPCADAISSDTLVINVFDLNAPPANAGPDQEFCLPVTETMLSANAPEGASTGIWTIIQGSGVFADPSDPLTIVSGLSVGENIFRWEIDNGVCGSSADEISVFIFDPDAAEANAGENQEFCTPVSTTLMQGNIPDEPGVGTWTLIVGNGTIDNVNDPNTAISGLTIGENIFSWTIYNGPCEEPTTDFVSIFIYDENAPDAFAGEDQELCLPENSTNLNADAAIFPASGVWSIFQGSGTIADVNNPNTLVSNLGPGVNGFIWTLDNNPCPAGMSADTVYVFVFQEDAPLANASPDQQICTPQSEVTMAATSPIPPQSGTWTLVDGSGSISDASDPNATISGLEVGINTFAWTIYNGPCINGSSVDFVSILVYDQNAMLADAGDDQELCLPQNTTLLNGNSPVVPATGFWSILQGSGNILNISDPNSAVTNLGVGVNIFQWTINNGPCDNPESSDTVVISVYEEYAPSANAGFDQELCTPTSTTLMSATAPVPPQTGFWTLISGTGTISDITDPAAIVSGLSVGQNTFSWTVDNGPCNVDETTDFVDIFVFDQNASPAYAGEDQELCLPENSTFLNADTPLFPASGFWTLVQGSGTIANPDLPNSLVSNLGLGTNIFEWTMSNGPCENSISTDTVSILVFEEESETANAGEDIEICTPQSCVMLSAAVPADPVTGTWTIVSGNGTIDDVNNPTAEICGLTVGETVLMWTLDNGPCENSSSLDVMSIFIFDENNEPANAGEDQELCLPETSTVLNATTPIFPATGFWILAAGSGIIANPMDPNSSVSGLAPGVNVLVWTVDNGPCSEPTNDSVTITVYDPESADADAGPDQFFCTPDLSTVMSGNTPLPPAIGTWEIIAGSGTIENANDPLTSVADLGLGINILVWSVYNGACDNSLTSDTLFVYVNDSSVANADAGPDQFYCGQVTELQLEGSETVGNTAIGTWSIIEGGGEFENSNNEFTYVQNVPIGVNTYVWTVDNLECGITSDTVQILVFDPNLPPADAGSGGSICEDEFSMFDLNGNPVDLPATSFWEVIEGEGQIDDPLNPLSTVISLGSVDEPGGEEVNVFLYTVQNGVCGNSVDTVVFVLEDCLTIEIPDAYSPNADGTNDTWVIPNLYKYPANSVKIFNRWGNLVYEAAPYDGTWDGRSSNTQSLDGELPVSTYYYILDLGDGSEPFHGFVYLKR